MRKCNVFGTHSPFPCQAAARRTCGLSMRFGLTQVKTNAKMKGDVKQRRPTDEEGIVYLHRNIQTGCEELSKQDTFELADPTKIVHRKR